MTPPLSADLLRKMDAYWRAANYLSVGQIYLLDNPLLREPLKLEHVKPRLVGHWGTTPGLNFVYVHLNRIIQEHDLNVLYVTGLGGQLVTAGVDVWLNTPEPPLEASGTSGMKAALNGVPSLSILDGWWIEGCIEGVTGWSIGDNGRDRNGHADRSRDATALYDKLEHAVIPAFYRERDRFIDLMRHAIALNGSFFNTQRMMQEYVLKAYFG